MEKQQRAAGDFLIAPAERTRLVHFCARITGNVDVAEDLTQEALLIAIGNLDALRDAGRQRGWLFGIARNVCLRWLRTHGRDTAHLLHPRSPEEKPPLDDLEEVVADDQDVELVLERKELIELLDRALALLPPETRTVLIQHYVEDSPLAEIAAGLGTNASAVAMRLRRGKLTLRRILTHEMQQELAPYTAHASAEEWELTSLWCSSCGRQRLLGQRDPVEGKLLLKCPQCSPGAHQVSNRNHLPILQGIRGYKPLYTRLVAWCDQYYRSGLRTGSALCLRCGRVIPAFIRSPENFPGWMRQTEDMQMWVPGNRYVAIACEHCASTCVTSLEFLILESQAGQRFLQAHPRVRTMPTRQLEYNGRPALLTRFESVTDAAVLDVISDDETYQTLLVSPSSPVE